MRLPHPRARGSRDASASERELRAERKAHAYARERGVSAPLYAFFRFLTVAVLRVWFRVRISGRENIPASGPALIAPNHKNFLDPFFVGLASRRHVRFMAKTELLRGPRGWLFLRLGAFPVRRGQADTEAVETARAILESGGLVVVFPEGTRVEEPDALGSPHQGAARLALETGAPIIPAAITGTSHLWRGAIPRLRRVQLAFLPAVTTDQTSAGPEAASALIEDQVWPAVVEEYGRLRATPGVILAGLAALGVGGGLVAKRRLDARSRPKLLGKLEPRKLRRKRARRRLIERLRG
jgi:1-acyl-sn-glycerol-3-phosphate acyltransferase